MNGVVSGCLLETGSSIGGGRGEDRGSSVDVADAPETRKTSRVRCLGIWMAFDVVLDVGSADSQECSLA